MSEAMKSKSNESIGSIIGAIIILIVVVQVGIVLFGDWFEADKNIMKDTAEAQTKITSALFLAFEDLGRLEVRKDYTVRAYISKNNYMQVAYPDRDGAIANVGKTWCEDKGINIWYMPKVVISDIQTGQDLGTYRCLFKHASNK